MITSGTSLKRELPTLFSLPPRRLRMLRELARYPSEFFREVPVSHKKWPRGEGAALKHRTAEIRGVGLDNDALANSVPPSVYCWMQIRESNRAMSWKAASNSPYK